MSAAIDVVKEMGKLLVAARQPGVNKGDVQTEIDELQNQLRTISKAASIAGENWLAVDSGSTTYQASETIVASFSRDSTGAITIGTIELNIGPSGTMLFDTGSGTESGILDTEQTFTLAGGTQSFSIAGLSTGIDISGITDDPTDLDTAATVVTVGM